MLLTSLLIQTYNENMRKGFTILELIIVIGILTMLFAMGTSTFTAINRKGRDNRRRSDIEQIRAAVEMYRTNSTTGVYPTSPPLPSPGLPFGSALGDGTNTYLQSIPQDPRSPARIYYYTSNGTDYTLATELEETSTCANSPPANSCGSGFSCNYCLGPYGKK